MLNCRRHVLKQRPERRRPAQRRQQARQADGAQREGRAHQRPRRHPQPPRRADRLAAGRPRLRGGRGSHLRQLDQERAGRRHGRPPRPPGPARRRRLEVVELVAPLARPGRRLQPGRSAQHRRRRPALLLRHELTGRAPHGAGASSALATTAPLCAHACVPGCGAARRAGAWCTAGPGSYETQRGVGRGRPRAGPGNRS